MFDWAFAQPSKKYIERELSVTILFDDQVNSDLFLLERAWSQPTTFAFLPVKSGVDVRWVEEILLSLPANLREHHFALLSSGSTGLPKLVLGERRRAEQLVRVLHDQQKSGPVKTTLFVLPLTYCYAFVNQWLWALWHGRKIVPTRGFSEPDTLKTALNQAQEAMVCMVGAQVPLMMRHFTGAVFEGVVRLHFAGGAFPQVHLPFLQGILPNAMIFNNYGCVEAMPRISLRPADEAITAANIGKPLPGIKLMVNDANELLFNSPFAAVGFADQQGIHELSPDEFIPTGDLARPCEDGSWEILGRNNEVFKRYGEKVAVPTILQLVATVWEGQVGVYREHDSAGEPGYVLVLSPAPTPLQLNLLLQALRRRFSRIFWPLRVESKSALPCLPTGKVDNLRLASSTSKCVEWRQRI